MNSLFALLGIETWKPVFSALLLPPVPFLVAILIGARLLLTRRVLGWAILGLSVAGVWFTSTMAAERWIERVMLQVPQPLRAERIAAIRNDPAARARVAIVVLGAGMEPFAPEYGVSNLDKYSLERLRYGLWLARETGVPVAFSGGLGWGQAPGSPEAEAAARIAAQDFNRPLRWTEAESHDTRENAQRMVPLLKRAGVDHVLLVTHGWHMPRALRHFEASAAGSGMRIEAAPMGLASRLHEPALDWLPSGQGFSGVRSVLREALARLTGA